MANRICPIRHSPLTIRLLRLVLAVHIVDHDAHAFVGHPDPVTALQRPLGVLVA
jgi:hypothetical protein